MARQKAKRKGTAALRRKAAVAAVSRRRTPPPRSRFHQRRPQGLGWPTARAALALAAVTAVAGVMGAALGLPVPVLGGPGGPIAASLTGNSLLDSGTPPGLTKGPYFPVVTDNPDFGEADARFGANRSGHIHQGQDVFVKPGTPLVAVRDGIVIDGAGGKSFYAYGGGNSLVIYSPMDDRSYVYMHMLHPALVHAGETVQAGQPVGQVGCTGSCDGPHLHFEIRRGRVGPGWSGRRSIRSPTSRSGRGRPRSAAMSDATAVIQARMVVGTHLGSPPWPRSPTSAAARQQSSRSTVPSGETRSTRRPPTFCWRDIDASRRMTKPGS